MHGLSREQKNSAVRLSFSVSIYMMRVATSLVIVALLTVAATAAGVKGQQEGNDSEDSSCIETFIDLEESLRQRNSNINRLHDAFFPSNQQVPVAVDLVHFSTSLQTTSYKLCNLSTARLDNQTADYKFRWSASAMLLFVPPEMLRPLSLYVYQGTVTTAEVVIDPMCGKVDSEGQQMEGKIYKGSTCTNKEKSKRLLNKLCIHVSMLDLYWYTVGKLLVYCIACPHFMNTTISYGRLPNIKIQVHSEVFELMLATKVTKFAKNT